MIEHISLRCRNARASRKFYEQALAPLGYEVDTEYGDAFGFIQGGRHDFWVTKGKVGTPNHLAFHADDETAVDEFYRAALAAGGKDNGAPSDAPPERQRANDANVGSEPKKPADGLRTDPDPEAHVNPAGVHERLLRAMPAVTAHERGPSGRQAHLDALDRIFLVDEDAEA